MGNDSPVTAPAGPTTADVPAPVVTDALVQKIIQLADVTDVTVYRRLLKLPVRGRAQRRADAAIASVCGNHSLAARPSAA